MGIKLKCGICLTELEVGQLYLAEKMKLIEDFTKAHAGCLKNASNILKHRSQ